MYTVACSPAEHEVCHWKQDDAEESGDEAVLGCAEAVLLDVRDEVVDLVNEEDGYGNDAGDADG